MMKLFIITALLFFCVSLSYVLNENRCCERLVYFSGLECPLESSTYRKMLSKTGNYLCSNVAYLGSTSQNHYFLTKDNEIVIYKHDNEITKKEIEGIDLREFTIIKAVISENAIFLEAINGEKVYTIVLNNFGASNIKGRKYPWGHPNLVVSIFLCNQLYIIKADKNEVTQKKCIYNNKNEIGCFFSTVIFNSDEEIEKLTTTNSITINIQTKSKTSNLVHVLFDEPIVDKVQPTEPSVPDYFSTVLPLKESPEDITLKISKTYVYAFVAFLFGCAAVIFVIFGNKVFKNCKKAAPIQPFDQFAELKALLTPSKDSSIKQKPTKTTDTQTEITTIRNEDNVNSLALT
jgi:hypothetical protein